MSYPEPDIPDQIVERRQPYFDALGCRSDRSWLRGARLDHVAGGASRQHARTHLLSVYRAAGGLSFPIDAWKPWVSSVNWQARVCRAGISVELAVSGDRVLFWVEQCLRSNGGHLIYWAASYAPPLTTPPGNAAAAASPLSKAASTRGPRTRFGRQAGEGRPGGSR